MEEHFYLVLVMRNAFEFVSHGFFPFQPSNARQARELRKLAVSHVEHNQHANMILDSVTQHMGTIGTVDVEGVVPPASIPVPTTYRQALSSPCAVKWEASMRVELQSIADHEVADTTPPSSALLNNTMIGTR